MLNKGIGVLLLLFFSLIQLKAEVRLPHMFGSNMVLQRAAPILIWGWADQEEKITLRFNQQTYQSKTNKAGKWKIEIPSMQAGGPYEMIISGTNSITLNNILIGDVWLCSGQSNMQWTIKQTPYKEQDSTFVEANQVRLFTASIDTDYMPREDVKGGEWLNLSEEHILAFSAVSYHFGQYLQRELSIPIGLISSNLGATSIETWMSNEALLPFDQFKPDIEPILRHGKNFKQLRADFQHIKSEWEQAHYLKGPGITGAWHKPETYVADWKEMTGPGVWEDHGLPDHDGAVWFRKNFDVPADFKEDSLWIPLSQLDDYDIVWVNGHKIGETYGRHNHRNYFAKSEYLHPGGSNEIVIRIFDVGGKGGFSTNAFWSSAVIKDTWKFKAGQRIDPADFPTVTMPNVTPFSSPGVLYNANIAPFTSMTIKGVIWYQGESNVERAYEYRELFPALIQDWRKQWNQPDLPFLFVQLANYYPEKDMPVPSAWAELREAQTMTLALPHTGMACTIDIGEADDIHPKNKVDVGKRLGLAALKIAYRRNIVHSGPTFMKMNIEDQQVIIHYSEIGSGLMSKDKYGYVHGFEIAGKDQIFHWAKAEIQGNSIVLTCDKVSRPVAVRYAWSDNPGPVDLYNKEGLPAIPFRTDKWKGHTEGKVYDHTLSRF